MKSARIATFVSTLTVILLVANGSIMNRITRQAVAQGNVGVSLDPAIVFLIKLDHFFVDYFYVLIPFLWLLIFGVVGFIRVCLAAVTPKQSSGDLTD